MNTDNLKFTLVSTVFNEASRIMDTLNDLASQTVLPDEVIITDAGSKDGTTELISAWALTVPFKVKILLWPKCNVAQGRNKAIENASYELIVSTDFGCRFHKEWFRSITNPFKENSSIQIVGGTYNVIETEIKSIPAKANYIICNGYFMEPYEGFIPSSRSIAYHKSVWENAGKYPEWLTLAADDLVFGLVVLKKGYHIHYVNLPYVYWGRHHTAKAYGKEAFRYGLGDGEARVNFRHFIIKSIETGMRYAMILYLPLMIIMIILKGFLFLVPAVFLLPGFRPYYWAFKNWLRLKSDKYDLTSLLFTIPIIELSRIQYAKGYIKGYFYSVPSVKKQASELSRILSDS